MAETVPVVGRSEPCVVVVEDFYLVKAEGVGVEGCWGGGGGHTGDRKSGTMYGRANDLNAET